MSSRVCLMVRGDAAHEGWQLKMPAVAAACDEIYDDLWQIIGQGEGVAHAWARMNMLKIE